MATTTITVKDTDYEVKDLPNNIQQAIAFYDDALDRVRKAESDLVSASSASKWLVNDITRLVDAWLNEDKEAVEEAVSGEEDVDTMAPEVVEDVL
jgi:flagellin-like hook-associated protein FlgL